MNKPRLTRLTGKVKKRIIGSNNIYVAVKRNANTRYEVKPSISNPLINESIIKSIEIKQKNLIKKCFIAQNNTSIITDVKV